MGAQGLSICARVKFLGHPPQVAFLDNILGRITGSEPMSDGSPLEQRQEEISGPLANSTRRARDSRMIRTDVLMIDVFNALMERQKISIFSTAGEPHDALLTHIGVQVETDPVAFASRRL